MFNRKPKPATPAVEADKLADATAALIAATNAMLAGRR